MSEDPIIYLATVNPAGNVDIQCRPTDMSPDGYGVVLASMVHATVNMFVAAGMPEKEALDSVLKRLNREARNPTVVQTFGAANLH